MTTQLAKLAKPIDGRYVSTLDKGKYKVEYVEHGVVEQYLVGILGRVPRQEVVREIYDGEILTGVVLRLTLVIDGVETVIEEAGAGDNTQDKTNGDRLKSAISDAYKRCAMRATIALSLWTGDANYFLHKVLREGESDTGAGPVPSSSPRGTDSPTDGLSHASGHGMPASSSPAPSSEAERGDGGQAEGSSSPTHKSKAWQQLNDALHAEFDHDALHNEAYELGYISWADIDESTMKRIANTMRLRKARDIANAG